MNDCEPCLNDNHTDCDTTAWTDYGEATACACWARGHPDFQGLWDTSQIRDPEPNPGTRHE